MVKVIKSHRRRVPGHGRLLTVATLLFCVCCWVLANHSRGAALAAGAATPGIAASGIPRLIHHMHINETALSPAQARLREGCQKLHPDWQFKFWTDELLEAFVKEEFADFYPEWIKIEPRINQLDSSRYMLMHRFGGIYMDVDVECVRSLNGLIDPLPPGAAWVGDWPEPSILASAPNNQLWLHVLSRIARVWRTLDAWHSTGPAGLGAAILEYVQEHGAGVLVPWLTADSRPQFTEFVKGKNATVPWYVTANGDFQLPDGSPLVPWHSPTYFPNKSAGALPKLPASEGLPANMRVGFLANELLDPSSCNAVALAHCVEGLCADTWPLSSLVHHCHNSWRGRIGTT